MATEFLAYFWHPVTAEGIAPGRPNSVADSKISMAKMAKAK